MSFPGLIGESFLTTIINPNTKYTDNQNMALLSAGKELIDKLNNQDMIESSLDTFTIEYISLFNNSYDEQNKTLNCLNIISNIIEKWHKDENLNHVIIMKIHLKINPTRMKLKRNLCFFIHGLFRNY